MNFEDMEETSPVSPLRENDYVPISLKQGTPTNDELEELGERIAEKWVKLGRRLDIDDPKLQEIDQTHGQMSEKGYHMLKHWKQEKGSDATYHVLCNALKHKLVQRQDLAEQFCYINIGTSVIQLPHGTGFNFPFASTCDSEASSNDQKDLSRVRSGLKRKMLEPDHRQGNLSFKIRCASATSRNSNEKDPQHARTKVNRYMVEKVDELKEKVDLSSFDGLRDFYVYLVGELHLMNVSFQKSSLKVSVNCHTLEILERLWDDYRSGHLNAVAETALITEKVKEELDMETITLTTTILEEDYLACRLSLVEISAIESCAADGLVELRGELESRKHELGELGKATASAEEELTEPGPNVDVASIYIDLGNILYHKGDPQGAKEHYERALHTQLKKVGPEHVDVARLYVNLGNAQGALGDLQQAKEHCQRALVILLTKFGPDHADVAHTYMNLGVIQHHMGDLQQAKEYCERALHILLKKLGPEHVDVARLYVNLGNAQGALGDLQQAKEHCERALDILLKKFGPEHVDVACTYVNLGNAQSALGDLQQAKEHYEHALDIQLKKLGPEHDDVKRTYMKLGDVQRDLGDLQRAKEYYDRAQEILLRKLGPKLFR